MKNGLIILAVSLTVNFAGAQVDTTQVLEGALEQAELMTTAFHAGNYDKFMDLTHPKIVRLSGGREEMKALLTEGLGPGAEHINTELSTPRKLIITDSTYQCSFLQLQIMRIDGEKLFTLGSLIGISYDLGENWTFIGVAKSTLKWLQRTFPELSDDLELRYQSDPAPMPDK